MKELTDGEKELKVVLHAALGLTDRYYWDSEAYAKGEVLSHVMTIGDTKTGKRFTVTVKEIPRDVEQTPLWVEGEWGQPVEDGQ